MSKSENFNTKCVHAGMGLEQQGKAAVVPIYQSSTFSFRDADHGANLFAGKEAGYIYSRMLNPTVEALENCVAELEGGFKGLATGSGMAAISTVLLALLSKGDHVICATTVYGPTITLVQNHLGRMGIEFDFVDTSITANVEKHIKPNTKVIYLETPGNPTLTLTDLKAVADIAKKHGAVTVVDNTFMSPVLQQPLALGIDVVIHSMTKYLNGHTDVVGGMIVAKNADDYKKFRVMLNHLGGILPPMEAFLVHRGIKTLSIRMKKHCENAMRVAEWLSKNGAVEKVYYPGLKSNPQYDLAKKQMKDFGGMISFELKGGFEAGKRLMNSVKLCVLAVSLGGVETLIQHPASMTHFTMGEAARKKAGISEGLVRLSVGIEDADDIIRDLEGGIKS